MGPFAAVRWDAAVIRRTRHMGLSTGAIAPSKSPGVVRADVQSMGSGSSCHIGRRDRASAQAQASAIPRSRAWLVKVRIVRATLRREGQCLASIASVDEPEVASVAGAGLPGAASEAAEWGKEQPSGPEY